MAGMPRRKLRKVQALLQRARALQDDLNAATPAMYHKGPTTGPGLAWTSARASLADAVADMRMLAMALQARLPVGASEQPVGNAPATDAPDGDELGGDETDDLGDASDELAPSTSETARPSSQDAPGRTQTDRAEP